MIDQISQDMMHKIVKLLVGVVVVAAKRVFDQILQDMMQKIVNYLLMLLWKLQNACLIKSCGV